MRSPAVLLSATLLALGTATTANAWELRRLHPFVEATADELPERLGPVATRVTCAAGDAWCWSNKGDKAMNRAEWMAIGWLIWSLGMAASVAAAAEIVFDFETGDLQGWKVVEGEFAQLISDRAMFHNQPTVAYNKQGRYFLTTLEMPDGTPSDTQTGTIVSPVFTLAAPAISLLVGGGAHGDTYVALCSDDGEELLRASGQNAEDMQRINWEAGEAVGRKVFLKVVDHNLGSWGHVTFDDFHAEGKIDEEATAALHAAFAELERARIEKIEAERQQRLAELMSEQQLFARGESHVYRGEHLTAISLPVGGIGAGHVEIDGRCVRHRWHIFNNFEQSFVPDSFFAVRAQAEGAPTVVRALQTVPVEPFTPMASLAFRGEYPFGWYEFEDPALPVHVSLETLNPLIPLDTKNSGIPCAIFTLTAENDGQEAVDVAFLATQQNAVGFPGQGQINSRRHPAYGGNKNRVTSGDGATILHMTSELREDAPGFGDMALMALDREATGAATWPDVASLADQFGNSGQLNGPEAAGPSPGGQTVDGALTVAFRLAPGEKATVPFVLTWDFPNARHGQGAWGGYGNRYAAWWSDALGVARYVRANFDELTGLTRLYHDTLYASNLPVWLLDRISSQMAVLRSNTCFWTRSGYFGAWEGCSQGGGCCAGNCSHVWHYAQSHARLFPELARAMREQEYRHQTPEGLIPFRQGLMTNPAGDAQCGAVLGTYREHLIGHDRKWLRRNWPAAKRAMEFQIATWDPDEDGVLVGPQHNTLDDELSGSSSWLGTMYLAALAAAERMADLQGDAQAAERYRRIGASGSEKQDEALWNGEYYVQIPEAEMQRDYGTGCHIDQVLGQWWAHQLDLGWVYPPERVRAALQSLLKHNLRADFRGITQSPRKFVADEDAGMQMITWPLGGRPDPQHCMRYADEVMSGFEYSAAAAMVQAGLLREGLAVVRAAQLRYDGRFRPGLAPGAWGYSGNPFGDDECGKFYARPMSIWSMLLACQGFIYDGPAGLVGFRPVWRPEDHRSFFTTAEGWGLFTQTRSGSKQTAQVELRRGRLGLVSMVFGLPTNREPESVTVTVRGKPVASTHAVEDGCLRISLERRVTLEAGEVLEVVAQ